MCQEAASQEMVERPIAAVPGAQEVGHPDHFIGVLLLRIEVGHLVF